MKLISIAILALTFITFNSATAAIDEGLSNYQGKIYSSDEAAECRMELARIIDGLEEHEGYVVVDASCAPYGASRVQVQMNYAHPDFYRIERFNKEMASSEQCSEMSALSRDSFEKAGNHYVGSHCLGKNLYVDFLDLGPSFIRNGMGISVSFLEGSACESFLETFTQKLSQVEIQSMFGACNKRTTFGGDEYHAPDMSLSAHAGLSLKYLVGKNLGEDEGCFEDLQSTQRNLEENGVQLVHAFCADSQNEAVSYEILSYLETRGTPRVRTFKGIQQSDKSACESQLARSADTFAGLGHSVLYKFCDEGYGKRFKPVIYYVE